ncbi:MAG: methyltransferase dimerization domain-containing protein [Paracoccaceae bacterium]
MNIATPPVNPARILDLEWGFAKSAALMAALEVGVFDQVAKGTGTVEDVAERCGISLRGATSVLQAMAALDLMAQENGHYSLSADAAQYLVSGLPGYLGDMHRIFSGMNAQLWPQLPQALRSGAPVMDLFTSDDASHWDAVFPFLEAVCAPMAKAIAGYVTRLPISAPRFLDVGSGAGFYSCAVAASAPTAYITCVDQQGMRKKLLTALETTQNEGQLTLLLGDIFTQDWGQDQNVVLFSHLLHGFAPDDCARLIAKAEQALTPGGTLIIHEFVTDPVDPQTTPIPALFGLEMLMTSHGDAYPAEFYDRMLTASGFSATRTLEGPRGATKILLADRLSTSKTGGA